MIQSPVFEQWWNNVLSQWADTLDVVVWLDAPNETLLERVQQRGHGYLTKEISTAEGYEFLERYRKIYEQVIVKFAMNKGLTLLRFKTDRKSPDQIADDIRVALDSRFGTNAVALPANPAQKRPLKFIRKEVHHE
jgi:Deoxynucleoside kinase.